MKIRVLIVDDEPLARRGIRARLARAADVEVVGECGGGRQAVEAVASLAPDLVFLDVQMPGLDGFGVVEAVGAERMPTVVFVTAFDQHALRAFEAQALDYLLKPVDDERFDRALERARRRIAEGRESALGRRIAAVMAEEASASAPAREPTTATASTSTPAAGPASPSPEPQPVERFLVRRGGRVIVVPADEVDWVEAAGDYVRLHVGREAHLLRETMGAMEAQLDPRRFARVHRSTIVNVERIRELHPHFNREHVLVLRDGTELKVSRGFRERLEALFGGAL